MHDEPDRIDVCDGPSSHHAHTQRRVASDVPGLAFKLIEEAEKSRRRINSAERFEQLLKGIALIDGIAANDNPPGQQSLAA